MSTWMPANEKDPSSAGYVRHWYIDLGDCFGSEWDVDGFSRRLGKSYLLDFQHILGDFATLGAIERPWERAHRTKGQENFGYFSALDFDPDSWVGEYPNPAFSRMTERDAAWATRIIAHFTPADVRAAVSVGNFSKPQNTEYLTRVLLQRQHIVLKRYFSKLSSLADVRVQDRKFCATDLARSTATFPNDEFHYSAELTRGSADPEPAAANLTPQGETCVAVAENTSLPPSAPDNAKERYLTLRISNGVAPGPLLAHFYDLGPQRGLRLVGLERPGS